MTKFLKIYKKMKLPWKDLTEIKKTGNLIKNIKPQHKTYFSKKSQYNSK